MVVAVVPVVSPQTNQSPSESDKQIKKETSKFYKDAHPYMNEPLADLKRMVPELAGLKPATGQD